MPRSRRSTLQTGFVATGLGLAGCLGFGGTNETVDVYFENESSTTHEITVSITFEREVLLEETATVEAGESTSRSFTNPETTGAASVETAVAEKITDE
jgi:hypothetical protein